MAQEEHEKKTGGSYLSPGVSMEEVSSGSKPIEGVGTAVAAFVGFVRRHPVRGILVGLAILAGVVALSRALRD